MAPKKPTPFEQQPRADSSSDDEEQVSNEEEVSSEEEEVSEEEDPKPDSSSEEEDGSDEEVTHVAPVKPVVIQSPKVGAKRKQKQPDSAPATAPASAVTLPKADGKVSKKSKVVDMEDKSVGEEEVKKVVEDSKKQLFKRLFSEKDEIVMLKALLDYSDKKKCIDPIEDFNDFHDLVKNSIHVHVTIAQLADKIKRLKKKYKNNARKTKVGVKKKFGKPHDQLCYELSKKIWGKSASASGGSDAQVVKEVPVRANSSTTLFCLTELAKTKDVVGMMGLSDDICKKGFELLSDEARAALEDKWKNIATAELELYHKRLEVSLEQVKLTLDALKASRHS